MSGETAAQLDAEVHRKLIESGEKERLKALLREKLVESGWCEELKARCRAIVQRRGEEQVTVAELVSEITPLGRSKVPDNIKAELLAQIHSILEA